MVAPFHFFDLHVVRTQRLGRTMIRVTFGGERLSGFASGGRDQRFKLFLPHPHQNAPVVPTESGDDWFAAWRAMDPVVRAIMRSYTVRDQRRDELDVDFALHGDSGHKGGGPASRWAARAQPGDRVTVLGPTAPDNGGVDFRPPIGTLLPRSTDPDRPPGWILIAADETALPAAAGILTWLPPGTKAKVWIQVPHPGDRQPLPTQADAEVTWLTHHSAGTTAQDYVRTDLCAAIRAAELPGGTPYAWIAGEAGMVRALRRHLVGERGFDRRAVKFTGYWRRGATEEDLLAEAISEQPAGNTSA
jgi:NADPH-dependent ferric siderophore reductase